MCPSTMRAWAGTLKAILLRILSAVTGRHAVLLGADAADETLIFRLQAPYRLSGADLTVHLLEPAPGRLTATLVGYDGHYPRVTLWRSEPADYTGPVSFKFDLDSGDVRLGGQGWGRSPIPDGRRFCWRFELVSDRGTVRRLTGHYRPGDGRPVDRSYYYGDDYVNYAQQSQGDSAMVQRLLREFHAQGPLLEIGCATGQLLAALAREGHDVYGVDFSEWGIAQATTLLGPGRAFRADVETEGFPAAIAERAPFGTVILWMVLEHFRDPFAVLAALWPITCSGALVFIYTTNADSLSHRIFASDWEGYFDWTHHGIERVSMRTLRGTFAAPDWELVRLTTDTFWGSDADPVVATMREWFAADARFRRLLAERDLGDFLLCVAVRR
jgi:2-polyprenyl-3-methyl-5-hydroxy-6-metoxy-1,4-benzoquinol methylase